MNSKYALLIGNSEYDDPTFQNLKKPEADVNALASVLKDKELGAFDEVNCLINEPYESIRLGIADLFKGKTGNDLLLLFFAGHALKDDYNDFYLAVKNTTYDQLDANGISNAYVHRLMDKSLCKSQVLILDCCNSGSFATGIRGVGHSIGMKEAFQGNGYGKVILTATNETQYAWEDGELKGQFENSVFTRHLVNGLVTGEADINQNGHITIDELYEYVHKKILMEGHKQTPKMWSYLEGNLIISQSPASRRKPKSLMQALKSENYASRKSAVRKLYDLALDKDKVKSEKAINWLRNISQSDDSRKLRSKAADHLREIQAKLDSNKKTLRLDPSELKGFVEKAAESEYREQAPLTNEVKEESEEQESSQDTDLYHYLFEDKKPPGVGSLLLVTGILVALLWLLFKPYLLKNPDRVIDAQQLLQWHATFSLNGEKYSPQAIDGDWGTNSENALYHFLQDKGLEYDGQSDVSVILRAELPPGVVLLASLDILCILIAAFFMQIKPRWLE